MSDRDISPRCLDCATTALACGRIFRLFGVWCCEGCRRHGAYINHPVTKP